MKKLKFNFSMHLNSMKRLDRIFLKHSVYYNGEIKLPSFKIENTHAGAPRKDFQNLSADEKMRRARKLSKEKELNELMLAVEKKSKKEDELIHDTFNKSFGTPTRASKVSKLLGKSNDLSSLNQLAPLDAFALKNQLGLTCRDYSILDSYMARTSLNLLPKRRAIDKVKIECQPDISNLQINEFSAKWNLQSIIDHTNKRAIESVEFIPLDDQKNLTCEYKYGFDGASGQKWYHQKSESGDNIPDKDLFVATILLLQIRDSSSGEILFENKSPNSSKFCRPILIEFHNEDSEYVTSMFNELTDKINNLQETIIYNFTCSF